MQRQPSQLDCDARSNHAELALLHALMAHYSRLLWDLQQTRIALSNRARAMARDGLAEPWRRPLTAAADDLARTEHAIDLQLARLARRHFLRARVEQAPGIGLPGFARLLAVAGPLDRFATVSALWAYLGLHVVDGAAPRLRRGERASWSTQGRSLCYQLGMSIVRAGHGRYREAYDRKKAQYLTRPRRGPSACPFGQMHTTRGREVVPCGLMHAHVAAMRYSVKLLLKDLWTAWRAEAPRAADCSARGTDGLPDAQSAVSTSSLQPVY